MKQRLLNFFIPALFILVSVKTVAEDSTINRRPTEVTIGEAIAKDMIELSIHGAFNPGFYNEVLDQNGVHFGKCMCIVLKSKLDSIILIRLDCGTQLIPDDTTVQTMIVTQKAIFPLYPNEAYTTRFYAMCGQLHDGAPTFEDAFSIGELADSGLVKLANYLGDNYIQNMPGQHAIWAYTDEADFEELKSYGADSLSILITKGILEKLSLATKLTPLSENTAVDELNSIKVNMYYLLAGLIVLILMTTTTIILVYKRRINDKKIS